MLPLPPPPNVAVPPMGFVQFFLLFQSAFWGLALLLPRPWFCQLFKLAFPFLPDRLEDFDDEN
ncbi:MAG TPA: hypothetical protein VEJ46_00925 [Candidatus Acidoferrum sp.]|nr:hypothetical protein [Candidatus Acidoferrum sp.]